MTVKWDRGVYSILHIIGYIDTPHIFTARFKVSGASQTSHVKQIYFEKKRNILRVIILLPPFSNAYLAVL